MLKKFFLTFYFVLYTIILIPGCAGEISKNPVEVGNSYFVSRNYVEAQKAYESALTKGYKTFEIYSNLGFIY